MHPISHLNNALIHKNKCKDASPRRARARLNTSSSQTCAATSEFIVFIYSKMKSGRKSPPTNFLRESCQAEKSCCQLQPGARCVTDINSKHFDNHYIILWNLEAAKGVTDVERNHPTSPACYSHSLRKHTQLFYLDYTSITVSSVSALSYWSRTVANELEAILSLSAPTDQREIWILTTSFRRHVTDKKKKKKGSVSFPMQSSADG